jgi:HSP20 family molecular chaperone IbpA
VSLADGDSRPLQAVYRDGLLTITAPKAHNVSTVTVKVEG